MKDLASTLKGGVSIAHAQITATTTGSAIDLLGFESASILVYVQTFATGDVSNLQTFTLTECATVAGTYTAVDSGDYIANGGWDRLLNDTGETGIYLFGYKRSLTSQRYIKVVATETGTTDITFSALVIKGNPLKGPISS